MNPEIIKPRNVGSSALIDMTAAVGDSVVAGDKFDVIDIDEDGVTVREGTVVNKDAQPESLSAMLAARMADFTNAAETLVNGGFINRARAGQPLWRGLPLTKCKRAARSKSKAQREARKAHNRARRNGKGKAR